jgi:uncharacterized LabA/DUF88 family protein
MAQPQDHISMALFCDFENVALGVRDANYDKFDIKRVLERLLLKGSIVVKKSYCDWERYKGFKAAMHEANFELIEIPHVRQSGKNSADIRLVVDALDLCYTKSHVNTFVIISGDSDFSPLVSKLRENAKYVIGVGVKQSTSDLLIANCDEFIFYDDLVRESQQRQRRDNRDQQPQQRRSPEEEKRRREEMDVRRTKVVEMAAETYEALVTDRDEGGRVWASVLKEALKRRNPGFSEQYYGFRTFGNLLEEAQGRGLLDLGRDEKSGLFVFRGTGVAMRADNTAPPLSQVSPVSQVSHLSHLGLDSHTRAEMQAAARREQQNNEQNHDGQAHGLDADEHDDMDDAGPSGSSRDEEANAGAGVGVSAGAAADRPRSGRGRQRGGRKTAGGRSGRNGEDARTPFNDDAASAPSRASEPAPAVPYATNEAQPASAAQAAREPQARGRRRDGRGNRRGESADTPATATSEQARREPVTQPAAPPRAEPKAAAPQPRQAAAPAPAPAEQPAPAKPKGRTASKKAASTTTPRAPRKPAAKKKAAGE